MAYPTDQVATGDLITAAQINRWMVQLSDTLLGASAASVDITSIPAHWTHLRLVAYARGDTAAANVSLLCRFNGDTGNNYDAILASNSHSATLLTAEGLAQASMRLGDIAGSTAPASAFDGWEIVIPEYAGTTGHKTARANGALKGNTTTGNLFVEIGAGWWRSTAAINRITLFPGAGNFVAGTRVSLYGMGRI